MATHHRPLAFWVILLFLGASIVVMLMGQTMAVFNYDLAVRLGLQESPGEVGRFGVEVNRGFGAGDTVVYIPLLVVSFAGLLLKRPWSLVTTSAAAGVSAYWAVFVGAYAVFGVWALLYVLLRGDSLVR